MEKTLIIIKPDGVQRGLIGVIFETLESTGLKLMACKMVQPDEATIENHYPHTREWIVEMGNKTLGNFKKMGIDPKDNFEKTDAFSVGEEVRKRLLKYWLEGPIVVTAWQGPSAVVVARKIRGHTFPVDAEPGTLHATYGFDSPLLATTKDRVVKTFIHTSGSIEEADREIDYWFKNFDFRDYETLIEHLYIT